MQPLLSFVGEIKEKQQVKKLVDMVDSNTEGLLIEFKGTQSTEGVDGWFLSVVNPEDE